MIYAKSKSSFIKVLEDELGLFIIKSVSDSTPGAAVARGYLLHISLKSPTLQISLPTI